MDRLTGFVSSRDKRNGNFKVRVHNAYHDHPLNDKEIPVEEVAPGVILKLYESVTFTFSTYAGKSYARDVRPVNEVSKRRK